MKKFISLLLGIVLVVGTAAVPFAQDKKEGDRKEQKTKKGENNEKEPIMSTKEKNIQVMLEIFRAIERRDQSQQVLDLFHPDVELHWPPSLPYGGTSRGRKGEGPTWGETWFPLQPTEAERRMDPRVVAASEDEVVVLWRQRGVSLAGDRFDGEVLGLYQVRDGKLARAQMLYFDSAALVSFLAKAKGQAAAPAP